jgi:starch-binding outer membrane protein, SusD/RagB family
MMRQLRIGRLAGAVLLSLTGACGLDLEVTNPNNPDLRRALASPEDVKSIAISSLNSWYTGSTSQEPYMMMAVTADVLTGNFGNFGMRFNNLEPRAAYVNNSAGGDRRVAEEPWEQNYGALGAANDVLIALDAGVIISNAAETAKYKALAQFTQAASYTNLALIHDKAFVVDEKTEGTPELKPYAEVAAAALTKWDALIAALNGKSETYDPAVFPDSGGVMTSAKLQRWANTMAARTLAYTPRTGAENAAVNWARVLSYAEKGISGSGGARFNVNPVGDDCVIWCSILLFYGNEPTWLRVDMRVINMLDPSQPVKFNGTIPPKATSADARLASDFEFHNAVIGDPARGIFMQSPYSHKRWRYHARTSATSGEGPAPYILAAENDLLIAEALVRSGGDLGRAATLINNTRVGRGNLPPATAGDGAAKLLEYIYYEHVIELLNTSGIELFDGRRFEKLQPGTVRHIPVPAKELEVLRQPIYTFGGVGLPDKSINAAFAAWGVRLDRNANRVHAARNARPDR